MNGDHDYYSISSNNAVAGPSKQPQALIHPPIAPGTLGPTGAAPASSSSPPHRAQAPFVPGLYLPPSAPPPPKLHLDSTQDLLARFNLHTAYDRYVRPAILPGNEPTASGMGAGGPSTPGDKGKGREIDVDMDEPGTGTGTGGGQPHAAGEGEDDDGPGGKGEKKKKNSYKHLIKGLPGKHSMKKDDYLTTIMLVPPKQHIKITPFDAHTREESFAVSQEGLKGWNINTLVLESAQAREDRKKRKELKRLAKLQQQQLQLGAVDGQVPGGVPLRVPKPMPAALTPSAISPTAGTPQWNASAGRQPISSGGTPRPGSTVPRSGSAMAQANSGPSQTSQTTATQRSAVLRPGSAVPRPGSAASGGPGLPPRPASAKPPATVGSSAYGDFTRGKKRDREEGLPTLAYTNGSNGHGVNGITNGAAPSMTVTPKAVMNAKAGNGSVRPRPVKRQRMDGPGQSNVHIQQQPTPQGV